MPVRGGARGEGRNPLFQTRLSAPPTIPAYNIFRAFYSLWASGEVEEKLNVFVCLYTYCCDQKSSPCLRPPLTNLRVIWISEKSTAIELEKSRGQLLIANNWKPQMKSHFEVRKCEKFITNFLNFLKVDGFIMKPSWANSCVRFCANSRVGFFKIVYNLPRFAI